MLVKVNCVVRPISSISLPARSRAARSPFSRSFCKREAIFGSGHRSWYCAPLSEPMYVGHVPRCSLLERHLGNVPRNVVYGLASWYDTVPWPAGLLDRGHRRGLALALDHIVDPGEEPI